VRRRRAAFARAVLAGCLALGVGVTARADEIVVKGDKLRGTVVGVTATTIEFETLYGKGKISVPIADVERVETEGTYLFAHGDDEETKGKIVGVEEDAVLVGDAPADAVRIQADSIHLVLSDKAIEESPLVAAKAKLQYWSADLDLGFSLARGTVDSETFNAGLQLERRKAPTRFLLGFGALYGTQDERGQESTTTVDQYVGYVRGEYDFTERFFGYGNGYMEYNGVQRLSIRGIPEAGAGYKIWKSEEKDSSDFVAATIGGSWVYERFFGGLDQNYFAIAFGGEAQVLLPYDAVFTGTVTYLPAVDDFANDFLIRSQAQLRIPVWEQLSFYFSVADDYDSTPAPDTSFNYLTTSVGLSAGL
jgi:hypothetical protein